MKRKTVIWTVGILLVALTILGVGYYTLAPQTATPTPESGAASVETAVARIGDLSVFASGTGQITALRETSLGFSEAGTLTEILVNVGDQVSTGEVLARLRVNKSAAQLEAEIAEAQLAVVEDQQALEALYSEADLKAAQALLDLESAQNQLEDAQNNDAELAQALQAVASAKEDIQDADMMLYIYDSSPSDEAIYTAYAALLFKEKRLNELKDELAHLEYEFKKAVGREARERVQGQIDRVTAQMYNQQIVYEQALYHYNNLDAPADPVDVNVAQSQMDTAQAQLATANATLAEAQQGPPAGDLALATAQVAEAQTEWERWKDGPDPQQVTLAEAQLETSQLALEMAQQESLTVELIAPFDGTVLSIDAAINEAVSGATFITLADTSQLMLDVSLDETDFQSAQVGNPVEVTFDAFPDETFSGSLVEISPSLESTFGSQAIKALAVLDETAFTKPLALPLGLNASVDVIAGEVTNVVLVPIEALHQTDSGTYLVYVQQNENFEPREVTVGLVDYTSAEITSGVQAGEVVVIGNIE